MIARCDEVGELGARILYCEQIDFMPGGALAVKDGDAVVAGKNSLMQRSRFGHPVVSPRTGTRGHASFASAHTQEPLRALRPGHKPVLCPITACRGRRGPSSTRG